MKIPIFQVDAFANSKFTGNPAAVCPLNYWLDTDTMQRIAEENNLSETAFFVANGENFDIRWFTPKAEMDLAGHPTLAAAHVILNELNFDLKLVRFKTQACEYLTVSNNDGIFTMDFPSWPPKPARGIELMADALGAYPSNLLAKRDLIAVFENESDIKSIQPNHLKLLNFNNPGVCVTAPGNDVDFVSRFFAPRLGILEDPVTGSAHCQLIPYWAKRLAKSSLVAIQLSSRGGKIFCNYLGDRVEIGGYAVTFMRGEIIL